MSEQTPENQQGQQQPTDGQDQSGGSKGYDTLTLVGRHVPDEGSGPFKNMQEATAAGHDTINPTTGVYQIGVLVDGAFVTLLEESAGRFANLVDVAKAAASPDEQ